MMLNDLLSPTVVVVIPRFSEAVKVVVQNVLPHFPSCTLVAISSSESESTRYTQLWTSQTDRSLLILREKPETQIQLLSLLIEVVTHSDIRRPLGVLVADGPDVAQFDSLKRASWNLALAESLSVKFKDLQVVEYSDSWKYSPPRIR